MTKNTEPMSDERLRQIEASNNIPDGNPDSLYDGICELIDEVERLKVLTTLGINKNPWIEINFSDIQFAEDQKVTLGRPARGREVGWAFKGHYEIWGDGSLEWLIDGVDARRRPPTHFQHIYYPAPPEETK